MKTPDYERVRATIADIVARIVLTQPDPDPEEETGDADSRVRPSVPRRPD